MHQVLADLYAGVVLHVSFDSGSYASCLLEHPTPLARVSRDCLGLSLVLPHLSGILNDENHLGAPTHDLIYYPLQRQLSVDFHGVLDRLSRGMLNYEDTHLQRPACSNVGSATASSTARTLFHSSAPNGAQVIYGAGVWC